MNNIVFSTWLLNLIFCITIALLGIFAMLRSRKTSIAFQLLYGLLAAYGTLAALLYATRFNDFNKMMNMSTTFLQSFTIIMLAHSIYLYKPKSELRRYFFTIITLIFILYPVFVIVIGERSVDPWVGWLTFDLLWAPVALMLIFIWNRRKNWPGAVYNKNVFHFVWYIFGSTIIGYICWCIDKFLAPKFPCLAYFPIHPFWHFFLGLSFYYISTLCRYLNAHEYGYKPELQNLTVFKIPFVEWK